MVANITGQHGKIITVIVLYSSLTFSNRKRSGEDVSLNDKPKDPPHNSDAVEAEEVREKCTRVGCTVTADE
jgi:hypothetical protein